MSIKAQQALKDLNRRLAKRGRPTVTIDDCLWFYDYSIGIGDDNEAQSSIWAAIGAEAGKAIGYAALAGPRQPLQKDRVPPEVTAAINPPVVTRENTEYIAAAPFTELTERSERS
ncbi:hypothetical protein [Paracoccus laeviglucosivorans]|uniref:hypothetical protein n=1 Tax=Paracoccus laeviglucosivorans TaxID=1197861 RepID=UPI001156E657|nr:hypothetical protein [Paracoccus laeviglucosivorans]